MTDFSSAFIWWIADGSLKAPPLYWPEILGCEEVWTLMCIERRHARLQKAELRDAAAKDIGDWFRFELGPSQPASDVVGGTRVSVTAYVGAMVWVEFHVDLVGSDLRMTGQPEEVPPLARVLIPDVEQHGYLAYPLVDHIADKVAATFETHGDRQMPSTRYRDLVDLVAIATNASVAAEELTGAVASEARRRKITLPAKFDAPDRALWEKGYAAEVARSLLSSADTLDEALAVVSRFIDPILDGTASGSWDPNLNAWMS